MKYIVLAILSLLAISCSLKNKLEKHEKAMANSNFIMENFNKESIASEFSEKYFPKEQTVKLLNDFRQNCNWENRKGKFVDFTTMLNDGKNNVAYVYEYLLSCDSLRFILIYDIDQEEPELFNLKIEPIEKKSQFIVYPEKQLKY